MDPQSRRASRGRSVSAARPVPARPRLGSVRSSSSSSSSNSGGAEAGKAPPLRAAPRRAPYWQELFLQRQREGDTGARERRAHRLQPSPPPRPRPRPPRPPGALEADALNASRCGAAARGDRAHDAGRTARLEPLKEVFPKYLVLQCKPISGLGTLENCPWCSLARWLGSVSCSVLMVKS
ncbi:uncharacterized protein V5649_005049 [Rhynchonycteris naso]